MNNILMKNSNGSVDILDEYGRIIYTVDKNEKGIIGILTSRLLEYENALNRENLLSTINNYFDVYTDTYTYNLIRDKSAFSVGTMTLNDFEEFTEENTSDLTDYLLKELLR